MNDINKKQNTEDILLLMFAGRKYYNKAERAKYTVWALTLLTFILSNSKVLDANLILKNATTSILAIITLILASKMEKQVGLGAAIKELIDRQLFRFPITEKDLDFKSPRYLREKAYELSEKYKQECKVQIQNTGKDKIRGVRDWYLDVSKLKIEEAIFQCQKENTYWDKKLTSVYMKCLAWLIGLIIFTLLIVNRNNTLTNIATNLFAATPIILMICNEYRLYSKFKTLHNVISKEIEYIEKFGKINKKYLEELQMKIYNRRKINFSAPSIIHRELSPKIHKIRSRFIEG